MTTSPKTAGWETPDVMRQDAYTIYHTPKQKRPQEKNTYIHITRCALSALQRPPAEGNRPADMARHTRHPGFEQPGARPGPPYYERTLSECAMSPHGRAARRETRPRYRANNGAENRRAAATAGTPGGAGRDKNDGDAPSQGPKGK